MALPEDQLKSIHDLALENAQKDDATRSVGAADEQDDAQPAPEPVDEPAAK